MPRTFTISSASRYASRATVRDINNHVRQRWSCYLNYIDDSRASVRSRVVGVRTRRGVTEFQTLHDGRWAAVPGSWTVEVM